MKLSETEKLAEEHGTPEYREGYEDGYNDHEKIMMKWVGEWDGSTNSALGDLLDKKFQQLYNKIERGK